ncbi:hypothetical protein BDV96DRAFT_599483 [Lophiotrema nucula]|uniref:Uncharacterized protein n=1 Tax=Lophiotrema nucula TaxID=690887 RepID=A0A6A5ZAJ9_9PLEO|nr:hypothetical protein BDV96DRAFT_599483 [Lophiotrema nucula]
MEDFKTKADDEVRPCDPEDIEMPDAGQTATEMDVDVPTQPLPSNLITDDSIDPALNSSAADPQAPLHTKLTPDLPPTLPLNRLPPTFEPVATWQPIYIRAIFNDLINEPCPEIQTLNSSNDRMWDGKSLACLQSAFQAFHLGSRLLGERQGILRFELPPLETGLRITGRNRDLNMQGAEGWRQVPDAGDPCRLVWTHTDFETKEWRVYGRQSIVDILLYVLDVWRMLERSHVSGRLRPVPMSDEKLLSVLESGDWSRCARFMEAKRAVERGCMLDAVVELCTPFVLQPKELDGQIVVFDRKEVSKLMVTRFDGYVQSTETWAPQTLLQSGVILQCMSSASPEQRALDGERRPPTMLKDARLSEKQRECLPKMGMIYNLGSEDDVASLVMRILLYRDEVSSLFREERESLELQIKNGNNDKNATEGEEEETEEPEKLAAKKTKQKRPYVGRGSPLRNCVDIEDAVSDSPMENISRGFDDEDGTMFTTTYLALALTIATLTNALPFDAVQRRRAELAPRAKSYSVINVDGGSTAAPEPSSTVDDSTKTRVETVKVTETPAVVTDTVTATVIKPTATPAPAPASTSSSSSSSSSSTSSSASESKPSSTSQAQSTTSTAPSSTTRPKPSVVTVVVTETPSPAAVSTEYYDDGQWHTRYIVKTFENAAVATPAASSSSSTVPIPSTTLSSVVTSQAFPTLESSTVSHNQTQIPSR